MPYASRGTNRQAGRQTDRQGGRGRGEREIERENNSLRSETGHLLPGIPFAEEANANLWCAAGGPRAY